MAELPSLMEKSLKTELENNLLLTQCSVLEGRLGIVKRSIANEREKQKELRDRLAKLRNGVRSAESSPPEHSHDMTDPFADVHAEPFAVDEPMEDIIGTHDLTHESCIADFSNDSRQESSLGSVITEGSPVSLRSKRKAMLIEEDSKVVKRLKRLA